MGLTAGAAHGGLQERRCAVFLESERGTADPEPIDGLGAMTWSEGPVAPELAMGLMPAAVPGLG